MRSTVFYEAVSFDRVLTLLSVTLQGKSSWLNFLEIAFWMCSWLVFHISCACKLEMFLQEKIMRSAQQNGRHFCIQSCSKMNKNAQKSNSFHLFSIQGKVLIHREPSFLPNHCSHLFHICNNGTTSLYFFCPSFKEQSSTLYRSRGIKHV